jgi:TrmH family RNA methyltransferase
MTARKIAFPNITVILVEPVYKGNVGAVSRVMNNFGIPNLRIVGTVPANEDFYVAVHSQEILKDAEVFPTFTEAIAGFDRVVAISRRKGRAKKADFQPRGLASFIAAHEGRIALVFGRETYGLKDEEAELCQHRCYIPASPHFPSLNLAQAVAVILYEIFTAQRVPEPEKAHVTEPEDIEETLDFLDGTLTAMEYSKIGDPVRFRRLFKKLIYAAECSKPELRALKQVFNRFVVLSGRKGQKIPQ